MCFPRLSVPCGLIDLTDQKGKYNPNGQLTVRGAKGTRIVSANYNPQS